MANTKSAKKAMKQNEKRRMKNLIRRSAIKTSVKKTIIEINKKEDKERTLDLLRDLESKLARAKGKRVMHANTASRKLSRLTKRFNKAFKEESAKA